MTSLNDLDDDFEPQFAEVPEEEQRMLEQARAEQESRLRRAAIGITAGSFKGMVVLPRSAAAPLLRLLKADPLPFGAFVGYYNGEEVELHHLDIITETCERYWPDVTEFIYGPAEQLEPALREIGIEPVPLPLDFMDAFERGLARYSIYGT
jgi:hypothetical protein